MLPINFKRESAEFFDINGQPIEKKAVKIDVEELSADKQGYDHYMMLEMLQQPNAIRRTVMSFTKDGKINFDGVKLTREFLKNELNKVTIVACGSAYHAGIVGKQLIEKLQKQMKQAAKELDFETAAALRDKIRALLA